MAEYWAGCSADMTGVSLVDAKDACLAGGKAALMVSLSAASRAVM